MLVMENLDRALARGVEPYCEITGYGFQMDSDPGWPGSGLEDTMSAALANANCKPQDIDYICAYGPGHPLFDRVELATIKRVFGQYVSTIPITSIKGATGNPLAAAGPMQVIASVLSLKAGRIPPTANCDNFDGDDEFDIVRTKARPARINRVLINVRGLGGGNGSMVVERLRPD